MNLIYPDNQIQSPYGRYGIKYNQLSRFVEFAVLYFRQMHATIQLLQNRSIVTEHDIISQGICVTIQHNGIFLCYSPQIMATGQSTQKCVDLWLKMDYKSTNEYKIL